jgi:hypothetical protein
MVTAAKDRPAKPARKAAATGDAKKRPVAAPTPAAAGPECRSA